MLSILFIDLTKQTGIVHTAVCRYPQEEFRDEQACGSPKIRVSRDCIVSFWPPLSMDILTIRAMRYSKVAWTVLQIPAMKSCLDEVGVWHFKIRQLIFPPRYE